MADHYGGFDLSVPEMDGPGSIGLRFDGVSGRNASLQGDGGVRCECCRVNLASVTLTDSTMNGVAVHGTHRVCMGCVQNDPIRFRTWALTTHRS